ncbi:MULTISPECIES: hypothetical protein [Xanthomonas]|uniref:hypothetical protein n=1 Tax=Xanthomonas TaxID=338 RepID=UPI0012905DD4|nr:MULTISPECIES: hypothetical protein [Xanthomonas]
MVLEIQSGVNLIDLSLMLDKLNNYYHYEGGIIFGNFNASDSRFVCRCSEKPEPLVAEGIDFPWLVGITGSFHCRADSLSQSREDVESFLKFLDASNLWNFVLSFRY